MNLTVLRYQKWSNQKKIRVGGGRINTHTFLFDLINSMCKHVKTNMCVLTSEIKDYFCEGRGLYVRALFIIISITTIIISFKG